MDRTDAHRFVASVAVGDTHDLIVDRLAEVAGDPLTITLADIVHAACLAAGIRPVPCDDRRPVCVLRGMRVLDRLFLGASIRCVRDVMADELLRPVLRHASGRDVAQLERDAAEFGPLLIDPDDLDAWGASFHERQRAACA